MPALMRVPDAITASTCDVSSDPFVQNLFVLCHGEHVKYTDKQQSAAVLRPWDPPLTERGKLQAWRVGRAIRLEDWNVTRVVVSPLLRCVQTATEVIAGLCLMPSSAAASAAAAAGEPSPVMASCGSSSIKASIECGLAETMRKRGVAYSLEGGVNKDPLLQPWTLDLPELYSMLPTEIQDPSFQPIRHKLPLGKESEAEVQHRYTSTFQKIANRYAYENILFITHAEGVMQSVSMMWPRADIYGVAYGAYTHGQRPIFEREDGTCITNGDWELLTESGLAAGIFYSPSNS